MSATKRIIVDERLTAKDVRAWIESGQSHFIPDAVITPDIALAILKYNYAGETNRRVQERTVSAFAAAMASGDWENTGEPIIISNEKLLNNGQHRLKAIVEANVPVVMDLRFGVARHAFGATDAGRKRTGAEALGQLGGAYATAAAASARLIVAYQRGLPLHEYDYIGNVDIVRALERWPDIATSLAYTSTLHSPLRHKAIHALAFFAHRTANEASVQGFFGIMRSGEGRADNPPHMLREVMLRLKGGRADTHLRTVALAQCILAWNAWLEPNKTKSLRLVWRREQPFPVVTGLVL
jgi:hypothetical protein